MPTPLKSLRLTVLAALSLACAANAEGPSDTPTGTQILFLGTAGGPPIRADRSEPATLVTVNGRHYLVDCGIGTVQRLAAAGIKSSDIDAIFLTHLHADHSLGLAEVMADVFFVRERKAEPIPVYGPPQTAEFVDTAFRHIQIGFRPFAVENKQRYPTENGALINPFSAREFARDGDIFNDGEVTISAAENSHFTFMTPAERERFKAYSLRITTGDGSFTFSGDTGPSDAVTALARDNDIFIGEATYRDEQDLAQMANRFASQGNWTPERRQSFVDHFQREHLDAAAIGTLASAARAKSVIVYHYNPVDAADRAAFLTGVRSRFGGPVFASKDLDRYCLASGKLAAC